MYLYINWLDGASLVAQSPTWIRPVYHVGSESYAMRNLKPIKLDLRFNFWVRQAIWAGVSP